MENKQEKKQEKGRPTRPEDMKRAYDITKARIKTQEWVNFNGVTFMVNGTHK